MRQLRLLAVSMPTGSAKIMCGRISVLVRIHNPHCRGQTAATDCHALWKGSSVLPDQQALPAKSTPTGDANSGFGRTSAQGIDAYWMRAVVDLALPLALERTLSWSQRHR